MTDETGRTDAELVAGVLAADRDAFAAVYDRYGTKLYDFAYSMLRHREDAADAVADSFVLVAERLSQLRDPERLRPWLYAIVRSECLRKLRARKRVAFGGEEQLVQMADDALTPDQEAERAAMQKIVWDASAGLADRDRALLDLHLRQGLEGAELGEAMGVSASNAYVMLNRLRAQVDRSLGALLIARLGRDDCDDLDVLLADWDGTFSPLVRKRVSRHVDDCDVCSKRRKKILSPWMLLAAVPMFAAPLTLRDRVVARHPARGVHDTHWRAADPGRRRWLRDAGPARQLRPRPRRSSSSCPAWPRCSGPATPTTRRPRAMSWRRRPPRPSPTADAEVDHDTDAHADPVRVEPRRQACSLCRRRRSRSAAAAAPRPSRSRTPAAFRSTTA